MLDLLLRNGTVVDGTGAPPRQGDVGVRGGRLVLDPTGEDAARVVDADGKLVCPGFVDVHTHYDAQLFWDPLATPSVPHGVTTMIGGNCGFTLAPLVEGSAEYLRPMMARVEGMPLEALERGVPWDWAGFGDYLAAIERRGVGGNVGFLAGHCAIRRAVMGADAVGRAATPEEVVRLRAELAAALAAGALGLSSTQSYTHADADAAPVPSRWAEPEELLALCEEVAAVEGTTLEYITDGCLKGFTDAEVDLMIAMSRTAGRPMNWNVLTVDHRNPQRHEHQLAASERAAAEGGRIVALTMPTLVTMNMSLRTHCALHMLPGWGDVMRLPLQERMAALRDAEVRRRLDEGARSPDAGVMRRLAVWERYRLDTVSPANAAVKGRTVGEIATERGLEPFDALVEVALVDELATVLWPPAQDDEDAAWGTRVEVWRNPHVLLGGSDAGAHLDRMLGAPYPAEFLGDCLRGRRLLPVEEAVRMLTDDPARLYGLTGRGRLADGWHADLVVLDPGAVGTTAPEKVADLPGGEARLTSYPRGVDLVAVNGTVVVEAGEHTGALPGTVLRSGRDTETVRP